MRIITRTVAAATVATAFLWANANAQSFDGDDVEGFIAVVQGAEALSDQYENLPEAEAAAIQAQMNLDFTDFGSLLDEDGDFRIFRLSTEAMSRAGDIEPVRDYRQLVTQNGFGDLGEFGEKADAIMMAYMATQIDAEDMAGMGDLTPEMMTMIPPGMREQMAGVMKLMTALENVPPADLEALRPYQKRLESALN